jgi:hypothetical protein
MSEVHRFGARAGESIKARMLRLVLAVAKKAKVKMAIGGGIAVASRGYRRDTMDVDAFFHEEDRQKVIRATRQLVEDYEIESLDVSHWIVVPPDAEVDERIDLLFTNSDPEESAIEMATRAVYQGIAAPMFTVEWIVVSKFLAEREDAKDSLDIWALYQRGMFDVKDIVKRLRQMGMREDAAKFPVFIEKLKNLKK